MTDNEWESAVDKQAAARLLLRCRIAAECMASLIAVETARGFYDPAEVAVEAVQAADALLKELER